MNSLDPNISGVRRCAVWAGFVPKFGGICGLNFAKSERPRFGADTPVWGLIRGVTDPKGPSDVP